MDLTKVEAMKNVTIYGVTAGSFTQNIHIPFIPDFMIVKYISYMPAAITNTSWMIYTDMVNDSIGSVAIIEQPSDVNVFTPGNNSVNLLYQLGKPISGTYTFTMRDTPSTSRGVAGTLIMNIEFYRFKAEKPEKTF
jgi:hypothetical protein